MKGQAVRHLKAEEGVKARVEFLHEAATSTWTTTSTDDAGEIMIMIVDGDGNYTYNRNQIYNATSDCNLSLSCTGLEIQII